MKAERILDLIERTTFLLSQTEGAQRTQLEDTRRKLIQQLNEQINGPSSKDGRHS